MIFKETLITLAIRLLLNKKLVYFWASKKQMQFLNCKSSGGIKIFNPSSLVSIGQHIQHLQ